MKSIIIYLSVTGNTELIAKTIKRGIEQAAGQCDIVKLKEAKWRSLRDYDLIGFGCPPMFNHVESPLFKKFINDIRFVGGKHAFVFATHGTKPDYIFPSMIPRLKRRGFTVIGMYDCYAPCYLSQMPWPYPTAGHPDEIDIKEAVDFGSEMVNRSRRISAGEIQLIPPVPKAPKMDPEQKNKMDEMMKDMREQGKMPYVMSFQAQKKFYEEKCMYPRCKLCMDNCPEDAIDLSVSPTVIGKGCIGCTFCAKICPTGAMDESPWVDSIKPMEGDVMQGYLHAAEEVESQGRFRRLLPIDKIGIKTPVYKLFNKHPQWIIGKGFNK